MTSQLRKLPNTWLAVLVSAALVGGLTYVRLVVYPDQIVPLTYALPLLVVLWHRNLPLHWAMAGIFALVLFVKMQLVLTDEELALGTHAPFTLMQLGNIVIPAVVLHAVVKLMRRLDAAIDRLATTNVELENTNEELVTRDEEINRQNEELQTQAEELEQQTEELSAQGAEMMAINEQLAARERTLAWLLDISLHETTEQGTVRKLGEALARLLAPRALAAAVLEPDGAAMRILPLFGVHADDRVVRREQTLGDLVVARDRAGFLADVQARPDLEMPRFVDGGRPRSLAAAPLRTGRGAATADAALEIYSAQPGEWSEQELRLVQWAAEQIGRTWTTARLRDEFERGRRLLRAVTENSTTGLFLLDGDGRCTYANPAAMSMTGYSLAELVGASLQELLQPESDGVDGRWPAGEHRLRRKDGARFAAFGIATAVGGDSLPEGIVIEVRDITEQRRAATEREQLLDSERNARSAADLANRSKDEFVAMLSHELRTPLNAILGWSTILRKGLDDRVTLQKGFEVIERNARHQAQLIADLLDMSKILAGKLRLDVQAVDLPLVVEAALDAVRPAALAKGVQLDKVVEPVERMVMGDPGRLQQVVWNLLTNAVKFTPGGGRVSVLVSRVASYVQIVVTDNGQGIAADLLPHVFQRYRQGSETGKHRGGLGLGLSIVQNLVELHGGTVHAKSEGEGKGASFAVLLPVRAVDAADAPLGGPHPSSPAEFPADTETPNFTGLSILVVDDDEDARELLSRVVTACGATVTAVGSGAEALAALERATFHLMVSDIGMPGMDGYELIRRVRAEQRRPAADLPAIALTAFARSEDRTRALLAGFQSHIAKPVESAELLATIVSLRPAPRQRAR